MTLHDWSSPDGVPGGTTRSTSTTTSRNRRQVARGIGLLALLVAIVGLVEASQRR